MPIVLPPATPAEAGWEEVYGPVWPWADPDDTPVLQNGHCRVRYDQTGIPGWRIDTPADGVWVEQGKVIVFRNDSSAGGAGFGPLDDLVSATLVEYTPDRAVVLAVMRASADPLSRERVYLTLQRGWLGPRVEVYAAAGTDGTTTGTGAAIRFEVAPTAGAADANDTALTVDAGGLVSVSTVAGGAFPNAAIGSSSMTGENWLAMLRQNPSPSTVVMAVVLADTGRETTNSTLAYGVAVNGIQFDRLGGYCSAHLAFTPQTDSQILEAEAIANTGSGTVSTVADAGASGGHAVKDTQGSEAHSTLELNPSSLLPRAKYRLLGRVRVDPGVTGELRANFAGAAGSPVSCTSTDWTWKDLGELQTVFVETRMYVNAWASAGAGVYIDRVELLLIEDRARPAPSWPAAAFGGVRDIAQSVLYDLQQQVRRIPRG